MSLYKPLKTKEVLATSFIFAAFFWGAHILPASAGSAPTDPRFVPVTNWGGTGSGNGTFTYIRDVAVNQSTGDVYVTDGGNNLVQQFSASGVFVRQWGGSGTGKGTFGNPTAIAIDQSTGDVYVTDVGDNNLVQHFTSAGAFVNQWNGFDSGSTFNYPSGLAVDSTGNVYVADTHNALVKKFTSSGTFISSFDGSNGGTALIMPYGLAVDPATGDIFVSDYSAAKVRRFRSDGKSLITFTGIFLHPEGLGLDSAGDLYIADAGHGTIQKFTGAGAVIAQTNGANSGITFNNPTGIGTYSTNTIYVVSWENYIQKFTFTSSAPAVSTTKAVPGGSSGAMTLVGTVTDTGGSSPTLASFDYGETVSYGSIASVTGSFPGVFQANVSGLTIGKTYHFKAHASNQSDSASGDDKTFLVYGQSTFRAPAADPLGLAAPFSATADSLGNMYIADPDNGVVHKYGPDGSFIANWDGSATGATPFSDIRGVAVSPSGDVFVTDEGNANVQEFTPAGAFVRSFTGSVDGAIPFSTADGIAFDKAGNVYVSDVAHSNVQEFTPTGEFVAKFDGSVSGATPFSTPVAVAVDGSGNVYVADEDNALLQEFSADGSFTRMFDGNESGALSFGDLFGVAVDASGNIFIVDRGRSLVEMYRSDGSFVQSIDGATLADSTAMSNPAFADIGADGMLYVTSSSDQRVIRLDFGVPATSAQPNETPTPSPAPAPFLGSGSIVPLVSIGGGLYLPVTSIAANKVTTSPVPGCPAGYSCILKPVYTRSLTIGSRGADVQALQKYLNNHGYPVSLTGLGSLGNESQYFGQKTAKALAKYQAAEGIFPAWGYFGPKTREVVK